MRGGERDAQGLSATGVLCRQRSGPQPLSQPLLSPLPIALRFPRRSARRTHRCAELDLGRGVRGDVKRV